KPGACFVAFLAQSGEFGQIVNVLRLTGTGISALTYLRLTGREVLRLYFNLVLWLSIGAEGRQNEKSNLGYNSPRSRRCTCCNIGFRGGKNQARRRRLLPEHLLLSGFRRAGTYGEPCIRPCNA